MGLCGDHAWQEELSESTCDPKKAKSETGILIIMRDFTFKSEPNFERSSPETEVMMERRKKLLAHNVASGSFSSGRSACEAARKRRTSWKYFGLAAVLCLHKFTFAIDDELLIAIPADYVRCHRHFNQVPNGARQAVRWDRRLVRREPRWSSRFGGKLSIQLVRPWKTPTKSVLSIDICVFVFSRRKMNASHPNFGLRTKIGEREWWRRLIRGRLSNTWE